MSKCILTIAWYCILYAVFKYKFKVADPLVRYLVYYFVNGYPDLNTP